MYLLARKSTTPEFLEDIAGRVEEGETVTRKTLVVPSKTFTIPLEVVGYRGEKSEDPPLTPNLRFDKSEPEPPRTPVLVPAQIKAVVDQVRDLADSIQDSKNLAFAIIDHVPEDERMALIKALDEIQRFAASLREQLFERGDTAGVSKH